MLSAIRRWNSREQGVYRAELVVENVYGCRDTAIMEHRVLIKVVFPEYFYSA